MEIWVLEKQVIKDGEKDWEPVKALGVYFTKATAEEVFEDLLKSSFTTEYRVECYGRFCDFDALYKMNPDKSVGAPAFVKIEKVKTPVPRAALSGSGLMRASLVLLMAVVLSSAAAFGQSFPAMTAPPEHAPMMIETEMQEQADPLEQTFVLGNIPNHASPANLVRTDRLSQTEIARLSVAVDRSEVYGATKREIADAHGMGAVDGSAFHSWVAFRGAFIMQYELRK